MRWEDFTLWCRVQCCGFMKFWYGCGVRSFFKDKKSYRSHKIEGITVFLTIFAWWQKDPDPYLWLMDPDPGGPITYGSGSATLVACQLKLPFICVVVSLYFIRCSNCHSNLVISVFISYLTYSWIISKMCLFLAVLGLPVPGPLVRGTDPDPSFFSQMCGADWNNAS